MVCYQLLLIIHANGEPHVIIPNPLTFKISHSEMFFIESVDISKGYVAFINISYDLYETISQKLEIVFPIHGLCGAEHINDVIIFFQLPCGSVRGHR